MRKGRRRNPKTHRCPECSKMCRGERGLMAHQAQHIDLGKIDTNPNYEISCMVCGASPTVGELGMCGPCTFGDAETVNGQW